MAEADAAGEHRIAVTHAGVGRMMRGLRLGLSLEELRELDTPQDAIFHFVADRVERVECAPLPSPAVER
jgi:hypothetical protein